MKYIALLASALLTGCAAFNSPPRTYLPDNPATLKDFNICQYESAKAVGSAPNGYYLSEMLLNDINNAQRQNEIMALCMRSNGYNPTPLTRSGWIE